MPQLHLCLGSVLGYASGLTAAWASILTAAWASGLTAAWDSGLTAAWASGLTAARALRLAGAVLRQLPVCLGSAACVPGPSLSLAGGASECPRRADCTGLQATFALACRYT